MRGLYSHFDNFGDRWVLTPTINSFTTSPTQGGTDGNMSYGASIRRPVEVIGSLVAGGRHNFHTSWFTWEISASRSASEDNGYSSAKFAPADNSPLNTVQFGVDRSNVNRPKFIVQNGVNIYDPSQYLLKKFDIDHSYSPQVNLQASASYVKQYNWGGHSGAIEIGGKIRNAHKFTDPNDIEYDLNDPTLAPLSSFPLKQTVNNFYDGSYTAPPAINYDNVLAFYHSNPNAFSVDPIATLQNNATGLYNLVERIGAGYVMNTISFGRFRLNTGIRFETTTEDVCGSIRGAGRSREFHASPSVKRNYTHVDALPSAELRIGLTRDSAIRLSYGRGVARPNFSDLAPNLSLTISTMTGGRNTSSVGNPDLKATHADNYDILFEQYLKPLGLIQAGFFYKDITDPIVYIETAGRDTIPATRRRFLQTSPINAGSAHVLGF